MSDERFDRDLGDVLREIAGEEAPMSLRHRLSDVTERAPIGRRSWFATPMRLSVVVAGLAVLALALLLWPRTEVGPAPSGSARPGPSMTVAPSASGAATPGVTPSSEPSTPSSTPPTPPPDGEWTGLVWSDPVTPPFPVYLYDLLPWGDGYVAVGELPMPDGQSDGAFFTSTDGVNWTVTERTDPGNERYPRYLEAWGGVLFAFSNPDMDFPASGMVPAAPPVVWRSPDGSAWSVLTSASWQAAWDDGWMFSDVASGPSGLVAIGNHLAGASGAAAVDPLVLRSVDGVEWTQGSIDGLGPRSIVSDIVAAGGGYALLGGTEDSIATGAGMPQAWFSSDGLTWVPAPVAGAVDGDHQFEVQAAHVGAHGAVSRSQQACVGCVEPPAAWVSTDGRAWQRGSAVGADVPGSGLWGSDGTRIVVLDGGPVVPPAPDQSAPELTVGRMSLDGIRWTELALSHAMTDPPERFWVVPDGVIYAGEASFWFGTPTFGP
jgi:hypothetical protein